MLKVLNTGIIFVLCTSLLHAETRVDKRAQELTARKNVAGELDKTAKAMKNTLSQSTDAQYASIKNNVQDQKTQVAAMKTNVFVKTAAPTNTDCWHAIVAKVNKYNGSPELKAQYAQRMYMQLATVTKTGSGYQAFKGS